MNYSIKHKELCNLLFSRNSNDKVSEEDILMNSIKSQNSFSENQLQQIRQKLIKSFLPTFKKQWQQVSRKKNTYTKRYSDFLENDFTITFESPETSSAAAKRELEQSHDTMKHNVGRTRKSYEEASEVTKRRRILELSSSYSAEELTRALQKKIAAKNIETEIGSHNNTDNKTLAMYADIKLSKNKYKNLNVHLNKICGNKILIPYENLYEAKRLCYPDGIEVNDSGAEVDFISLLTHTVKRILIQFDRSSLEEIQNETLLLVGKWGMDGASGQQTTRQKWSHESSMGDSDDDENIPMDLADSNNDDTLSDNGISNDKEEEDRPEVQIPSKSDATVFIVSFSPLQLKAKERTIWTNSTPNSIHTCRTVKFEFQKDTNDYVKGLYDYYTSKLEEVGVTIIKIDDMSFKVAFDLKCTMIDGKVCNTLTGQKATNSCNICGVAPRFINNFDHVKSRQCSEDFYKFGLSSLHCKIRCMEYLLKLGYNSDFKEPQALTQNHKQLRKEKKTCIQKLLKMKLSLTVDVVKQGAGTTNTGNVARTFFENAKVVAECLGVDENLITRFHNILQVISCNMMIDCVVMKIYCEETYKMCLSLYGWYKIPPSVHKLLIHGSDIINCFNIPFGWLSEEPQEGNNKIFRRIRLENSRMLNRKATNEDIMHYLMILSDMVISSLKIKDEIKIKPLSEQARKLLISNL